MSKDYPSTVAAEQDVTDFAIPWSLWWVMGFAFLFIVVGGYLFNLYVEQRGKERFDFQTLLLKDAIRDRMRTYEQVLRGGVGLFMSSSNGVTREEWHHYVNNARLDEFYPGIQGMGYSIVLQAEEVAAHEAEVRAEGFADYQVHPLDNRQQYQSIVYLEPFDWRNRRAFGFDMSSEPTRRKAINRAIATGEAAMSGKITLVQETGQDQQAGFLMYLPLYHKLADGTKAIQGMVYAPFRMNNLMEGILGDRFSSLQLEIYDGDETLPETLMYQSGKRPSAQFFYTEQPLSIAGHQWLIATRSFNSFVSVTESLQRLLLMIFGGLFWLMLFYFQYHDAKARFKETKLAQALLANEERFRLVIEASPSALIMVNRQGVMILVNAHAEALFKYNRDELLGQSVNMLLPEQWQAHHTEYMAQYLTKPIARSMSSRDDLFGLRSDGSLVAVEVGLTPLMFSNGQAILATINDVSERKQVEMEKASHTAELERINRELDSFAYIASHDLKSPLRGIEQLSDWLSEDLAENTSETVQKYLGLIRNRVQRMTQLLDGLLAYSRIGRVEAQQVETDTGKLVRDIFSLVCNRSGFTLEVGSEMPVLTTARVPLELVFRNLFNNAIKHHDGEQGVIQVSCFADGKDYCFCVEDDGPGIPPKYHEKVFVIFQTLKPRDEVEGSGMGLSLVKKTVESVGGRIWLESQGRGCRFYFTWPSKIKEQGR